MTELSAPDCTVHMMPSTVTGEPSKPAHGPEGVGVALVLVELITPVERGAVPVGPTGIGALEDTLA